MTGRPSARVVIVNWRNASLTLRSARSVLGQLGPDDRLVVVDNHSEDGSARRLRDAGLDVVETEENLGFGAGVNAGARGASEDVLVLLNNDAVAAPGFLDALVAPLDGSDPRLGATTALLVLTGRWRTALPGEEALVSASGERWARAGEDAAGAGPGTHAGTVLVNSTGNVLDRSGNGQDRDWLTPLDALQASPDVFGVCGGACAVRADAWLELGGFREDLFMYYEDTDLSWRLREAGYTVRFVEGARAEHEHAASSGAGSPMFTFVNARNRVVVALDHAPAGMVLRAVVRTTGRLLRGPDRTTTARALGAAVAHLPGAVARRTRGRRTAR